MHPDSQLAKLKQAEMLCDAEYAHLVSTLSQPRIPIFRNLAVRLGVWLVQQGEHIQARYSDHPTCPDSVVHV